MEAGFKYYVTVGSAVHDVVQTLMAGLDFSGLKTHIIADWTCRKCVRRTVMSRKPKKCNGCGGVDFKFHECTIDHKGVLGHVDMILEVELPKPTKEYPEGKLWIVVDFKTSSIKKTTGDAKTGAPNPKMVSSNNKSQIRAYVCLLRKMGKPVTPYAVLVYIPRDNPFQFKSHALQVDFSKEARLIMSYKRQHRIASTVKTREDLVALVDERPCSQGCLKQFEWCKWRHMCAGEDNRKAILRQLDEIRKAVDHRLPIATWQPVNILNKGRSQDELV